MQSRPTQAMAPKQDEEQNRRNIAPDGRPCCSFRLISEVEVVPPGDPQPDDAFKMEQVVAAVSQMPQFADLWGPDGIPPDGYPDEDPRHAHLHLWLQFVLWQVPEADIDTPQKLRVWDLMQDKYNL